MLITEENMERKFIPYGSTLHKIVLIHLVRLGILDEICIHVFW
jgi:hypothetical protein